jgi:hypothetical protein
VTVIEIPNGQAAAFMAKAAAEGFPLEAWVQRAAGVEQAFLEHAELWWRETPPAVFVTGEDLQHPLSADYR